MSEVLFCFKCFNKLRHFTLLNLFVLILNTNIPHLFNTPLSVRGFHSPIAIHWAATINPCREYFAIT